jgi:calcineurin-like phosphoesterase family protein
VTVFVISDTHFGHANILDYEPSRRAWAGDSIASHDAAIIEAWRATVAPDDDVIHCGDFALGHRERAEEILRQLTGRITIVLGNHDRGPNSMQSLGFHDVRKSMEFEADGLGRVVIRHAPSSFTADELASADVLLHGHMHGHIPGANDAAPDRRHAYPMEAATRAKLVDASIEALPSQPAPMRLRDLVAAVMGT